MTQKKDNRLPILDEKARCVCGLKPMTRKSVRTALWG